MPNIGELINGLLWIAIISVPLAIWKVIDIIFWLWKHVNVSWGE